MEDIPQDENFVDGDQHSKITSEEELILKLYDVGCFKFGNFKMRNGEISPVYVDMRVLWSYPQLVVSISELMWAKCVEVIKTHDTPLSNISDYVICGIPYQGIPFATYLSTRHGLRMLLKRQEVKKYGTCRLLEGSYSEGDRVILVDDVLMTGGTLIDDVPMIEKEGLNVDFGIVFIDRQQGGMKRVRHLVKKDIHSVFGLDRVFEVLLNLGKINQETSKNTLAYLKANRFDSQDYGVNGD